MNTIESMSEDERNDIADKIIATSHDMIGVILKNMKECPQNTVTLAMISAAFVMTIRDIDRMTQQNGNFVETVNKTLQLSGLLHSEHGTVQ